jgi:hypothetical protein
LVEVVDELIVLEVATPFRDERESSPGGAACSDVEDMFGVCPDCSLPLRMGYPLDNCETGTSVCPSVQG